MSRTRRTQSFRRGAIGALSLAVTALGAADSRAQVPEVAIARQLAIQGIDAVESGDCARGVPLLERAEEMHHASVHLQYLARCHLAAGRLVLATEMWRQILREGAPSGASPAILAALAEASTSLERALPRLGSTLLRAADTYPGLTLILDGTPIPAEIIGTPQALDPGRHELRAQAKGFRTWSHRWSISEGGTAEVVVSLQAGVDAQGETPPAPARDGDAPFPLATVGWVTAATGTAALVAGTVTLLTRNSRRSKLETSCPDKTCPRSGYTDETLADEQSAVRSLTAATNVLMFGGVALVGGGITMIVLGQSRETARGTALLVGGPGATPGVTVQGRW